MHLSKQSVFAVVLLILFALFSFGCVSTTLAEQSAGAEPKHIILSWTGDPSTTQTITWQTDVFSKGQVIFAEKAGGISFPVGGSAVLAETEILATNKGNRYIHTAFLDGLMPNTQYTYQAGDGVHWTEPKHFVTAAKQTSHFQFLVFGDSQSSNYAVWGATLQSALLRHPQAAFMTNVGDLVDVGQDYAHWEAWLNALGGNSLPMMPVVGNHETYTPARVFSPPNLYTAQFNLPRNGPDGIKEQVYSFDYGDVHFVVLDSQEGEQREFTPDLIARQKTWLDQDLRQSDKHWKIVFMHRPPYDNRTFRDNAAIRNAFVPLFDKHHVDMVFTGHDHVYARTFPLTNGKPAPGGVVYVASGRSGTKTYSLVSASHVNEFFYNPTDEPNYLHVEVSAGRLNIKAFKQSGALIDSWELTKDAAVQQ